jgi:hypothetical protein
MSTVEDDHLVALLRAADQPITRQKAAQIVGVDGRTAPSMTIKTPRRHLRRA